MSVAAQNNLFQFFQSTMEYVVESAQREGKFDQVRACSLSFRTVFSCSAEHVLENGGKGVADIRAESLELTRVEVC